MVENRLAEIIEADDAARASQSWVGVQRTGDAVGRGRSPKERGSRERARDLSAGVYCGRGGWIVDVGSEERGGDAGGSVGGSGRPQERLGGTSDENGGSGDLAAIVDGNARDVARRHAEIKQAANVAVGRGWGPEKYGTIADTDDLAGII